MQQGATVALLLERNADPFAASEVVPFLILVGRLSKGDDARVTSTYLDHIEKKFGRAKMLEVATADDNGWTPMSTAAYEGDAPMTKQLIEHGVDPNRHYASSDNLTDTDDEWPAIFFARVGLPYNYRGCTAVLEVLRAAGADEDAKTKNGLDFKAANAEHIAAWKRARNAKRAADAAKRAAERKKRIQEQRQRMAAEAALQNMKNVFTPRAVAASTPPPPSTPGPKPSTPSAPRSTSDTPVSGSTSGSIVLSAGTPSPAPAAAPEPKKEPPATLVSTPTAPPPRKCWIEETEENISSSEHPSIGVATQRMQREQPLRCPNHTALRDVKCEERRFPIMGVLRGKMQMTGEKVSYWCSAKYTCKRERCEQPGTPAKAVKQ